MDPNTTEQFQANAIKTGTKMDKKTVLIIVILLLIILIGIGWVFIIRFANNTTNTGTGNIINQSVANTKPTLSLKASPTSVKVGETFTVTIEENANQGTGGTDIILLYNPKMLSVEATGAPVQTTGLYQEYPLNSVDENQGKIAVSGISSTNSNVVPKGIFGTIKFKAKTAGKASINFDFQPGGTASSNIVAASSAKNILENVKNLEITINP